MYKSEPLLPGLKDILLPALITLTSLVCNYSYGNYGSDQGYSNQISISKAYIRQVPPGTPNTAAYMHIISTKNNRLIKVSGSIAEHIELHQHNTNQDGIMQMRPVNAINLPADTSIKLQPGGSHIMLLNLNQSIKPGDRFSFTFYFNKGKPITRAIEVRTPELKHSHHRPRP